MILSHKIEGDPIVIFPIKKKNRANIAVTKIERVDKKASIEKASIKYHFKSPSELLKYKGNDDKVYKEVISLLDNEQKKILINDIFSGEVSE